MARTFVTSATNVIVMSGIPPVAGLSTCSIVARASLDSSEAFGTLFMIESSNNSQVALLRNNTQNSLLCLFRNANGTSSPAFSYTFDGTMRSVIATYNGAATPKVSAYVNGTSQTVTSQPTNTTIGSAHTAMSVGSYSTAGTSNRISGKIAELAIYNRVITPEEALMHAAGFSCRNFPRGMIFYAPLIREVHDIVGGLTGTITGTTVSDHPRIYA